MKKYIAIILFALIGFSNSNAQSYAVSQGASWLSGSINYANTSQKDVSDSYTKIALSPSYEYFIVNNVFIGANLGVQYESFGASNDNTIYTIGPSVGYSFANSESKVIPFISGGYQYLSFSNDYTGGSVNISLGLNSKLADHIGLRMELSYVKQSVEPKNNPYNVNIISNAIGLGIGISGLLY